MDVSQYTNRIRSLIQGADLSEITPKSIRLTLEKEFQVDLTEHKRELKELVYDILESVLPAAQSSSQPLQAQPPQSAGQPSSLVERKLERNAPPSSSTMPVKKEPGTEAVNKPSKMSDEQLAISLQNEEYLMAQRPSRNGVAATRKRTAGASVKRKRASSSTEPGKEKKKRNTAFNKPQVLSHSLAQFIGTDLCSRPEVVKRIWAFVKERDLQDPKDKRYILCDESLKTVFGKARVSMFEMNKILSKHLKTAEDVAGMEVLDEEDEVVSSTEEEDAIFTSDEDEDMESDTDVQQRPASDRRSSAKPSSSTDRAPRSSSSRAKRSTKTEKTPVKKERKKRAPSASNPFNRPVQLSDKLAGVLGASRMSRPQVVKKLWEYIKGKDLQDPKDKRFILCDEALHGIFKSKRVSSFGMNGVGHSYFTINSCVHFSYSEKSNKNYSCSRIISQSWIRVNI